MNVEELEREKTNQPDEENAVVWSTWMNEWMRVGVCGKDLKEKRTT